MCHRPHLTRMWIKYIKGWTREQMYVDKMSKVTFRTQFQLVIYIHNICLLPTALFFCECSGIWRVCCDTTKQWLLNIDSWNIITFYWISTSPNKHDRKPFLSLPHSFAPYAPTSNSLLFPTFFTHLSACAHLIIISPPIILSFHHPLHAIPSLLFHHVCYKWQINQ